MWYPPICWRPLLQWIVVIKTQQGLSLALAENKKWVTNGVHCICDRCESVDLTHLSLEQTWTMWPLRKDWTQATAASPLQVFIPLLQTVSGFPLLNAHIQLTSLETKEGFPPHRCDLEPRRTPTEACQNLWPLQHCFRGSATCPATAMCVAILEVIIEQRYVVTPSPPVSLHSAPA